MKQGAEWRCASALGETHLGLAITVSGFRERRPECDTIALTGATDDLLPVALVAEVILKGHGTRFCMGTSLPAGPAIELAPSLRYRGIRPSRG